MFGEFGFTDDSATPGSLTTSSTLESSLSTVARGCWHPPRLQTSQPPSGMTTRLSPWLFGAPSKPSGKGGPVDSHDWILRPPPGKPLLDASRPHTFASILMVEPAQTL